MHMQRVSMDIKLLKAGGLFSTESICSFELIFNNFGIVISNDKSSMLAKYMLLLNNYNWSS